MNSFPVTVVKSIVFVLVTALATVILAATIRNTGGGGTERYYAVFTDVTSLHVGDDVRMAGVRIGSVAAIGVDDKRLAKVTFDVEPDVDIQDGATADVRFRNLVGQRYVALAQPADVNATQMKPGSTFDLDHTAPALDLTVLFNGFQPLFRLLSPKDVNDLSYQIIRVFQGEGTTVDSLLQHTASLTSTLADRDQVIGSVIDNLNRVLDTVNDRSDQLDTLIVTLRRLVSGLAEDRTAIGGSIQGIGLLTTDVSTFLKRGRPGLRQSIKGLGSLSANLADNGPVLDDFLKTLPTKLDQIGRTTSYGSWVNFYLCSISGDIARPEGYVGDIGANPVAGRCSA